MGPKEKYFLDHYRKIYSFNNNDEIPENSIVIGYNDDDSSDDEGLGFRGVIEAWFDKAPHHRSILKEIDWDFHVGKIISSNDDRISSEQKDYSSGYYLEDLYGEVIGPFDFAMILELDTGNPNSSKNKNKTPRVKETKTMAAKDCADKKEKSKSGDK